jgi:hypothetical protein
MNEPQLTNVTPGAAQTPGVLGTGARPPGGVTAARRPLPWPIVAVLILLLVFVGWRLTHRANSSERLAASVTRAIANNDMSPVEKDFNAIRRPELENRGKVGRLSDFVNADGSLKSVQEDTPSGSPAGYHHFIAHFDKGDLAEDMKLDDDGKIVDFHVRPVTATQQ